MVPPVLPAADVQEVTQLPQTRTVKPASPKQLSLHPDLVPVEQLEQLAEVHEKWCVVRYLGNIYPGIVTNIDDVDIEDKYMNSVGVNRFSWPQYQDDGCWYTVEDGLFVIPEPEKRGSRHIKIIIKIIIVIIIMVIIIVKAGFRL